MTSCSPKQIVLDQLRRREMQAVVARDDDKALERRRGYRLNVSVAANQLEAHEMLFLVGFAEMIFMTVLNNRP